MPDYETEFIRIDSTDFRDTIATRRDCNIEIETSQDEFFIYVRGRRIEISSFNKTLHIEPRATNNIHIYVAEAEEEKS
jgi:hypothetical protein